MKDEIDNKKIRVYKFFNGETVIAYENDFDADKGIVYLEIPLKVTLVWDHESMQATTMLTQWLELGDDSITQIPVGSIITVVAANEDGIEDYIGALAKIAARKELNRIDEEAAEDSDTDPEDSQQTNVLTFKPKTIH